MDHGTACSSKLCLGEVRPVSPIFWMYPEIRPLIIVYGRFGHSSKSRYAWGCTDQRWTPVAEKDARIVQTVRIKNGYVTLYEVVFVPQQKSEFVNSLKPCFSISSSVILSCSNWKGLFRLLFLWVPLRTRRPHTRSGYCLLSNSRDAIACNPLLSPHSLCCLDRSISAQTWCCGNV